MVTSMTFTELVSRVINHDQDAATEIVDRYGNEILREVRIMLLTRSYLRRAFDSGDIVQSVLAKFFLRADLEEMDLREPKQLIALLREMARNRVRDKARYRNALRRNGARERYGADEEALEAAVDEETPSQIVQYEELLQRARELLTARERRIADLRSAGVSWEAIALELGEGPEALRKQFSRAMERVVEELDLGPSSEG